MRVLGKSPKISPHSEGAAKTNHSEQMIPWVSPFKLSLPSAKKLYS